MLDAAKIVEEVLQMRTDIQNNEVYTREQYSHRFKFLHENAPTLFDMVLKDETTYLTVLQNMIRTLEKIRKNSLSQHDADVEIGKELAEKYIYPNIDMEKEL